MFVFVTGAGVCLCNINRSLFLGLDSTCAASVVTALWCVTDKIALRFSVRIVLSLGCRRGFDGTRIATRNLDLSPVSLRNADERVQTCTKKKGIAWSDRVLSEDVANDSHA